MRLRSGVVLAVCVLTGCGAVPDVDAAASSGGWTVTVYYTAVESFHDGESVEVTGCTELECENGDDPLGDYPEDFVEAVKDEGTGRISSGTHAGRYLNWSEGVGYWLDTEARDSYGDPLRPFVSAAADADVIGRGRRFTISDCGDVDVGARVCERFAGADWIIADEFTPGLGGAKHVDVYLGEEDRADFTESPWYTTLENAELRIRIDS